MEETRRYTLDDLDNFFQKKVAAPQYTLDDLDRFSPKQEQQLQDYSAAEGYSADDLVRPEFEQPIRNYMVDRFGDHMRETPSEELVDKFLSSRRQFASGNLIDAVNEISYLNDIGDDEEKMARAGQAYEIYENMEGMFGDTSWAEKGDIVADFAQGVFTDPATYVGFGFGKVATSVGFKAGSQIALLAAKQTYKKKLAAGLTKEAAQEAAERSLKAAALKSQRKAAQTVAKKQALQQGAKTVAGRILSKEGMKEIGTVAAIETASAIAADYMYQDALIRTKVQDEYNVYQTGLAALGGIITGGIAAASLRSATDPTRLAAPQAIKPKVNTLNAKINLFRSKDEAGRPFIPDAGNWAKDVKSGVELEAQDTDFFINMLLGNDELGLKGLVQTLSEQGYVWSRRTPDDKVSNWIGDIIKNADPQDAKQFINDFTRLTGIDMATKTEKLTVENFADTFKRKMSDTGKVLNAVSQAARILGKDPNKVTLDDYITYRISGAMAEEESKAVRKFRDGLRRTTSNGFANFWEKEVPDFQNNVIRLMVSNPATTVLNVAGYAQSTALNSAVDLARATIMAPVDLMYKVANPSKARTFELSKVVENQRFKMQNILDPNTTHEAFMKYVEARPEATKELTRFSVFGTEDIKRLSDGFDPDKSVFSMTSSQIVDTLQKTSLVQAQDMYSKSIEFTTQLDKQLRREFDMGWNEFFSQQNYRELMQTEKFLKAEAFASEETLKATFSKSYKDAPIIGDLAAAVENARNLPVVGLMVPFGRFFNNTVGFTLDAVGAAPLISKAFGRETSRDLVDAGTRFVVSGGFVASLVQQEIEYAKIGLNVNQELDPETGAVVDRKYEYPYSLYKAAARVLAMKLTEQPVSGELVGQLLDQFGTGQLTRQLGSFGDDTGKIFSHLLSDEEGVKEFSEVMWEMAGTAVSSPISAATRFYEPVDVAIGLARGSDAAIPDRAQAKFAVDSLRYMQNTIAAVTGEPLAPEKQTATSGTRRQQPSKFFSTSREAKLTATDRVMNMIGKPDFMVGFKSNAAIANNRANQVFHSLIEMRSQDLLKRKSFVEGLGRGPADTLNHRKKLVAELMTEAKTDTVNYLSRFAARNNDNELALMIKLGAKKDQSKLAGAMRDLGFDKGLEELSYDELLSLDNVMKFRDDYLEDLGRSIDRR